MPGAINDDYWTTREAQERVRAELSTDPSVQRVHRELADRYAALAQFVPGVHATN